MIEPREGSSPEDLLEQRTTNVVRAAKLDPMRFAELYQRVAPSVYAWASIRLKPPIRNFVDPEDIVSEVWVRALARLDTYDPSRASFRTWAFAIANHVLLQSYRKLRTRGSSGSDVPSSARQTVSELPDEKTSVSELALRDERLKRFIDRLQDLKEEDKLTLIHCGFEGLTSVEAAPLLQSTPEATAKRWQRLRERLKDVSEIKDLLAPA